MEKISFIIPVYGVEDYLSKCLDSILTQHYKEWEAVLVDDGSMDGSGAICDAYAARDKRFRVIHSQNNGVVMARLAGFTESVGKYVSFVDADDWLAEDFLMAAWAAIEENAPDIVILKFLATDKEVTGHNIDTSGTRNFSYAAGFYDHERLQREIYPSLLADPKRAQSEIPGSLWGKVIKRQLLEDNIHYLDRRLKMGEDQVWLWPALMQAESMTFLDSVMYFYRRSAVQVTARYHENLWEMYSRVIEILREANQEKKAHCAYDFSTQIDLMQAQFAVNALDNEFLPREKGGKLATYRVIRKISHSESLHCVLRRISYAAFSHRRLWLYLLRYRCDFMLFFLELLNVRIRRH